MHSFDGISIASVMVLECFVCGERSGLSRVYIKSGTNVKEFTLASRGLEELFFQLCCCVSFWFWREIGFGFTYLRTLLKFFLELIFS
jgi:hypothetical protein